MASLYRHHFRYTCHMRLKYTMIGFPVCCVDGDTLRAAAQSLDFLVVLVPTVRFSCTDLSPANLAHAIRASDALMRLSMPRLAPWPYHCGEMRAYHFRNASSWMDSL